MNIFVLKYKFVILKIFDKKKVGSNFNKTSNILLS